MPEAVDEEPFAPVLHHDVEAEHARLLAEVRRRGLTIDEPQSATVVTPVAPPNPLFRPRYCDSAVGAEEMAGEPEEPGPTPTADP